MNIKDEYIKIYESRLLTINAKIENNHIKLNSYGPLKLISNPIINKINVIFEEEKTIMLDNNQLIFSSWIPPFPSIAFNRMIYAHIKSSLFNYRIPDQLSIGVTSKCPNKCIHCGAFDIMNSKSEDLDIKKIIKLSNESIDLGTYLTTIDGGEPLIRKDICNIIKEINCENTIVSLFTSGFNLNEKLAYDLKNSGLYSIKISLDSTYEEKHDKIRGRKGSYNDVINAIKCSKNANILTDLYLTISPYNIDELEQFYDFAVDKNVDEISITGIIAIGKWKEHENETITKKDIDKLTNFHKNKNKKTEGPRITAMPYMMGSKMFGCFAGQRWIHVTNSGDVLPCPYTPISFGNINNTSLKDIWKKMTNSDLYKHKYYGCRMRDSIFRKENIF